MEIKNRKLNRFNSTVEATWYALSDFYRIAIIWELLVELDEAIVEIGVAP